MRPDSMTSATQMDAEDSLVWDIVAMAGMLPDGNYGQSSDIIIVTSCRIGYAANEVPHGPLQVH